MKTHLPIVIFAVAGLLLQASGEVAKECTVRFLLPRALEGDRGLFSASLTAEKGPAAFAPARLDQAYGEGHYWTAVTFKNTVDLKRAVFGFSGWATCPLGTVFRPIDLTRTQAKVELPHTYYVARWAIGDGLSRQLDLHPGATYLKIKRVVPEKSLGTTYDPLFYVSLQMAKNLANEAYEQSVLLPFLDPGVYEFAVETGLKPKEVLRRRIVLKTESGLAVIRDSLSELTAKARNAAVTEFAEQDVVPWTIFRHRVSDGAEWLEQR